MSQECEQSATKPKIIGDHIVLRKMRELRSLSRDEAGLLIGKSRASVQRDETNCSRITKDKIDLYLKAYGFTNEDFMNLKIGRVKQVDHSRETKKLKVIQHKELRRSYKKIINRETKALRSLRQKKGLSQYQASEVCGYHRTAIGWIENGRIELTEKKMRHIVESYGYTMNDLLALTSSELDREEVEQACFSLIRNLSNDKLESVKTLLKNFA